MACGPRPIAGGGSARHSPEEGQRSLDLAPTPSAAETSRVFPLDRPCRRARAAAHGTSGGRMGRAQRSEKEILNILREARLAPRIGDVIRRHGINPKTYYRWKDRYGLGASTGHRMVRHLKTE